MKPAPRWLAACALSLVTQCGGGNQAAQQSMAQPPVAQVAVARQAGPAPVLDEVPLPREVVLVVRVAPIRALLERAGQLSGLGEALRTFADPGIRAAIGDEQLAELLDREAPVDVAVVVRDDGVAGFAFAFGAPPLEALERQLGQTHRFTEAPNGVRRIQAQRRGRALGDDEGSLLGALGCLAAPTPQPDRSRVVCGDTAEAVDVAAPYLARTLTRRDVPANTITAEVAVESLRQRFGNQATQLLEGIRAEIERELDRAGNTSIFAQAAARPTTSRLLRELFENLRSVVTDGTAATTTLELRDDRLAWSTRVDLRTPTGSYVRALADATRGQPAASPELTRRLLPEGYLYSAGSFDLRPGRALANQIFELVMQIVQSERGVSAADAAALRAALTGGYLEDVVQYAFASGFDAQGEQWYAGTSRYATRSGADEVAAIRAFVTAVRRPGVARAIHGVIQRSQLGLPDVRQIRELPVTGLPAGSFAFSMPSLSAAAAAAAQARAQATMGAAVQPPGGRGRAGAGAGAGAGGARQPASRAVSQVLFVPNGHDSVWVLGPDARAIYARYQANTAPGVDPQFFAQPGTVYAIVPAGIPNSMRAQSAQQAADVAATIARLPDGGRTPVVVRLTTTDAGDGVTRFAFDVDVRQPTLGAIGAILPTLGGGGGP